ncbi:anthrone oxygenase family protein [Halomonas sp. HP20-15]|uniref:anthrone oxygenase family protein n=1 Tax=Halomonas sp. HP20-15 TaxID=3085901 RepID=UPI0029827D64|nr:anthrone oxygenase family protein [Halomonas sp. HP20-15]MDW5377738.1 anthrone oxygenase family protein [Halomonas sp. HP20-15]
MPPSNRLEEAHDVAHAFATRHEGGNTMVYAANDILLWFSALGCGLMAGLYFAFSTFVMTALGRIDQGAGILAMNSINSTILASPFMPLFFATTLAGAVLAILALFAWNEPGSAFALAGGLVYVVGMFGVTMLCNVPLNNELDRAKAKGGDEAAIWTRYLRDWTRWNHLRTLASTLACGCFIAALLARAAAGI